MCLDQHTYLALVEFSLTSRQQFLKQQQPSLARQNSYLNIMCLVNSPDFTRLFPKYDQSDLCKICSLNSETPARSHITSRMVKLDSSCALTFIIPSFCDCNNQGQAGLGGNSIPPNLQQQSSLKLYFQISTLFLVSVYVVLELPRANSVGEAWELQRDKYQMQSVH